MLQILQYKLSLREFKGKECPSVQEKKWYRTRSWKLGNKNKFLTLQGNGNRRGRI